MIVLLSNDIVMLRKIVILLFAGIITFLLHPFVRKRRSRRWYAIDDKSGFLGL